MIHVTKTYLPPFEEYAKTLKRAWDKAWITNNGELVQELEQRLKEYLGVKHLYFCNNGTIVLQMALKALEITGEVITTPFSYVATLNSILWEGATPVFADIEEDTYCIDVESIKRQITPKTQAILATHVYGFPCAVEAIEELAGRHGLKVIYDGAHAFGATYGDKALLSYGDISTCSFHATKIFHSVEGGCIITNNDEVANKLMLYRQFGHVYDNYYSVGINGKNSEFHAAMGLCVLDAFPSILQHRKDIFQWYSKRLKGLSLKMGEPPAGKFNWNYSYIPVVLETEQKLLQVVKDLNAENVFPRRYFYPSLNELSFVTPSDCPTSSAISRRVICLPSFHDLQEGDVDRICQIIKKSLC